MRALNSAIVVASVVFQGPISQALLLDEKFGVARWLRIDGSKRRRSQVGFGVREKFEHATISQVKRRQSH